MFTGAGLLAPIGGLSPFVPTSAPAVSGPDRRAAEPAVRRPGLLAADAALRRAAARDRSRALIPTADGRSRTRRPRPVDPLLGGGRPDRRPAARPVWAHQGFAEYPPAFASRSTTTAVRRQLASTTRVLTVPQLRDHHRTLDFRRASTRNCRSRTGMRVDLRRHVAAEAADGRYGEPILFRHHNGLPVDVRAEPRLRPPHHLDARAQRPPRRGERRLHRRLLLPGPVLRLPLADRPRRARHHQHRRDRSAWPARPTAAAGSIKVPGDWRETMSTHWFHDHMFSFTAQNVYKGNAAMINIYSGLDRGNEEIDDGVNLRLPSGTGEGLGQPGLRRQPDARRQGVGQRRPAVLRHLQLRRLHRRRDDGELAYKPYFEVERRKYRFRILNAQRVALLQDRAGERLGRGAADRSRSPTTATCCRSRSR